MKKVYTNAYDVCHLFAQQTQYEARCSNVFFYGTKIYSYGHHYLLAEFLDSNTILINDKGCSRTTSKHISYITSATSQYKQYFVTKHDQKYVTKHIKNYLLPKLRKAKKPELYLYGDTWDLGILPLIECVETFRKEVKIPKYGSNDGRMLQSEKDIRYLRKLKKELETNFDNFKEKAKELIKKEKEQEKRDFKKAIQDFKEYKTNWIKSKFDYLRLSKDRTQIETSQGVEVSVKEALILYKMILAKKDIKGYRIENYTVISLNGTLKIGCHNINMKSIHEVGKQLLTLKSETNEKKVS